MTSPIFAPTVRVERYSIAVDDITVDVDRSADGLRWHVHDRAINNCNNGAVFITDDLDAVLAAAAGYAKRLAAADKVRCDAVRLDIVAYEWLKVEWSKTKATS